MYKITPPSIWNTAAEQEQEAPQIGAPAMPPPQQPAITESVRPMTAADMNAPTDDTLGGAPNPMQQALGKSLGTMGQGMMGNSGLAQNPMMKAGMGMMSDRRVKTEVRGGRREVRSFLDALRARKGGS